MDEKSVRADLAELAGRMTNRLAKYRRNYNRYVNNGKRVEDIRNMYSNPLSFYSELGEDTGLNTKRERDPPSREYSCKQVVTNQGSSILQSRCWNLENS